MDMLEDAEKSPCLPKCKICFWLMIQERINTYYLTIRKNFHVESNVCVLCDDAMPETMEHLIFTCDFSRNFCEKLEKNGIWIYPSWT
jgi:hypothetical protein